MAALVAQTWRSDGNASFSDFIYFHLTYCLIN